MSTEKLGSWLTYSAVLFSCNFGFLELPQLTDTTEISTMLTTLLPKCSFLCTMHDFISRCNPCVASAYCCLSPNWVTRPLQREIPENLRLPYSSSTSTWERYLAYDGVFIFFGLKEKIRGRHINNHILEFLGSKLAGIEVRRMCIGLPRDCHGELCGT